MESHQPLNFMGVTIRPTTMAHTDSLSCRLPPICTYFQTQNCRNGHTCVYRHELYPIQDEYLQISEEEDMELVCDELDKLKLGVLEVSITNGVLEADIQGTVVTFGRGAEVISVKLPLDFSSIQVLGLGEKVNAANAATILGDFLQSLGISNKPLSIYLSPNTVGKIASIKLDGSRTAKMIVERFESIINSGGRSEISIREVMPHRKFGKRIQLNTVTCSWKMPFKRAFMMYKDQEQLQRAQQILHGSTLQVSVLKQNEGNRRRGEHTLQVRDLDENADQKMFDVLLESEKPDKITLKFPRHFISTAEAESTLKALLNSIGPLCNFTLYKDPKNTKVKAKATFLHARDADHAVQMLHDNPPPGFHSLSVKKIFSVRYSIPNKILGFIRKNLDELLNIIKAEGLVKAKLFPMSDSRPYSNLLLSDEGGQVAKEIAAARECIEALLAGIVILHGTKPLWHPSFKTPQFLQTLGQISRDLEIYVHRDIKKEKLVIYGGSAEKHRAAEGVLQRFVLRVNQNQTIELTPFWFREAVRGGMTRISVELGTKVALDPKAKSLIIRGTSHDLERARALLLEGVCISDSPSLKLEDCCICWGESSNPIRTSCGHVYCKDCLLQQFSSAGDKDFPVRCQGGEEGSCREIFDLEELKKLVSSTAFHQLLVTSLENHIKTHPEQYFFCPGRDCESIFRPGDPTAVDDQKSLYCFNCLSHICLECKATDHEGLTCAENKAAIDGREEFDQFKTEHDVKDCTKCFAPIEKSEGCNHMECANCHAHLCWLCMALFENSQETYRHLTVVHGGIGFEHDLEGNDDLLEQIAALENIHLPRLEDDDFLEQVAAMNIRFARPRLWDPAPHLAGHRLEDQGGQFQQVLWRRFDFAAPRLNDPEVFDEDLRDPPGPAFQFW